MGRIFNSARFDAVPIFEKNGGNTNAESFVQLLDDAAKLAIDNNENVTKDKSLLTDPNMVDIALGSDDVNIGKNMLTNTNRAFGKLFLQYWAYKLLVNDKSFYSRVPADYDHEQTYTVGNEEFNFKSGMEHNAKCLYRYLLQTQQMALRLTFPEGMLDDLATPSLKQILAKGREWKHKFENGLAASHLQKMDTKQESKHGVLGWIHHFRLLQGADTNWTITNQEEFVWWNDNNSNGFVLSDYLHFEMVSGEPRVTWVVPARKKGGIVLRENEA